MSRARPSRLMPIIGLAMAMLSGAAAPPPAPTPAATPAPTLAPTLAQTRDLTVALRDGLGARALRPAYLDAFAATGPTVAVARWPGGLDTLRAHAADWDVVAIGGGDLLAGCSAGLLEKLDWKGAASPLRGLADRLQPQAAAECGVGAATRATVLAWESGKVQGSPGWADFWDVVKIPGKRGLQEGVRGNLEIALLADGVAPADLYRVLRTDAGVERALRKLGQLRPYIVWWRTPEDALRILRSGEALMTSAPAPTVAAANQAGGPPITIQPAGSLTETVYWAMLKDSPNKAEAQRFLAFAAAPEQQAAVAAQGAWAGLARSANDTAQAATSVPIDTAFWRDNLEKLTVRFQAQVGK